MQKSLHFWQIVPRGLGELISSLDPSRSRRVMEAMFKMAELDIRKLKQAAKGIE